MPKRPGRKRGSSAYNPIDVHVGARLRTRRTLLGLSQTVVGDAMGITFQQLYKYESGHNRISASRLFDVSQILDVSIGYFFDEMDQETKSKSPARVRSRESPQPTARPIKWADPLVKRETLELVRAYYKIHDPKIRNYLRKLFQAISAVSSDAS